MTELVKLLGPTRG